MSLSDTLKKVFVEDQIETMNRVNQKIFVHLSCIKRESFLVEKTITDLYPLKDGKKNWGAAGSFHSNLSSIITNVISQRMEDVDSNFRYVDEDGIDFIYHNSEVKSEVICGNDDDDDDCGDFKATFLKNHCWTGNGCSKKRGYMVLMKFEKMPDDYLLNKKRFIKGMFIGKIHSKYIVNARGTGDSDVSQISIDKNNFQHLECIFGESHCATKKINFTLKDINYDN